MYFHLLGYSKVGETIHGSTVLCSFQATPHSEGNQRCMTLDVNKYYFPASAMHHQGFARSLVNFYRSAFISSFCRELQMFVFELSTNYLIVFKVADKSY